MLSGHGVVAAVMGVMIVLSVGTTAESLARTAAMTAGPLLYVIATLAVRADHELRHTLQIAGLAWFVATWLVIVAYDFSRRGERTG